MWLLREAIWLGYASRSVFEMDLPCTFATTPVTAANLPPALFNAPLDTTACRMAVICLY